MPICSYLVIPTKDAGGALRQRLSDIPGCEVIGAVNRDVILLVTDTDGVAEEAALGDALAGVEEIGALILAFGGLGDEDTVEESPPASVVGARLGPVAARSVAGSGAQSRSGMEPCEP